MQVISKGRRIFSARNDLLERLRQIGLVACNHSTPFKVNRMHTEILISNPLKSNQIWILI